jgi:hypothetical protein
MMKLKEIDKKMDKLTKMLDQQNSKFINKLGVYERNLALKVVELKNAELKKAKLKHDSLQIGHKSKVHKTSNIVSENEEDSPDITQIKNKLIPDLFYANMQLQLNNLLSGKKSDKSLNSARQIKSLEDINYFDYDIKKEVSKSNKTLKRVNFEDVNNLRSYNPSNNQSKNLEDNFNQNSFIKTSDIDEGNENDITVKILNIDNTIFSKEKKSNIKWNTVKSEKSIKFE